MKTEKEIRKKLDTFKNLFGKDKNTIPDVFGLVVRAEMYGTIQILKWVLDED